MSREELARDRSIWLTHGVMLVLLSVATGVLAAVVPTANEALMFGFAALLGAVGLTICATRPPAIGTVEGHIALVSVYGLIGIGELAYSPDWEVPLGAAMFIGTLVAMRVTDPIETVGHLLAATACLTLPALILHPGPAALVGLAAVVAAVWILTGATSAVLGVAEAQGRQLEELLRRDPLTGVGNQRCLDETLERALALHARVRRPLALIAVDLTEFSDLNERFGRAACDELLARAAAAIEAVLRSNATVSRPVDDEFWIVVPDTDRLAANDTVGEIRWALSGVRLPNAATGLAAAVGVAASPADALHGGVLAELARDRMNADRDAGHYPAPVISETRVSPDALPIPQPLRGVSRAKLSEGTLIWSISLGIFVTLAATSTLVGFVAGGTNRLGPFIFAAALAVCGVLVVSARSARPSSIRNQLAIATLSCCAACGLWGLQPEPGLATALAVFVPPLIAVRLQTRPAVIAHLGFATVVFISVGVLGSIEHFLTRATELQIALLAASMWSLGLSCMLALELAEAQGRELEELVRTDPVTGVGNRLLLYERLAEELARHRGDGSPLSIVMVELIETFENSRGASELLLAAAASIMKQCVAPTDAVVRRRGHEFVLILPAAEPTNVDQVISTLRSGLADLAPRGHSVACLSAVVSYPDDGATVAALLRAGDDRLTQERLIAGLDWPATTR